MRGDGTYRPKQYKYTTVSKKLADNIQELGLKLGYSIITSKERSNNPKHNDVYYVRLNKGSKISYIRKNQSSLINYHGKVYCVTVLKYNILCIKRNEKIGNTRVINPGALFRIYPYTIALLDVEKDNLEFVKIS
jgi:hypothetical protein